MGKDLTIKDIARLSGVSKSTVSRIINNESGVRESTRKKVLAVIAEQGFTPSTAAKELSSSRYDTIGIFAGDISNQYYAEILRGAESVISYSEYSPFICLADTGRRQKLYMETLMKRRIGGMIFASTNITDKKLLETFLRSTPAVAIQTSIPGIPNVDIDNFSAAYDMASLLIGKGHRRFGYLNSYNGTPHLKDRVAGFKKAMKDNGIDPESLVYRVADDDYIGIGPVKDMLLTTDITAIQCANDRLAADAYVACKQLGKSIPDDVSICGFDGLKFLEVMDPGLSGISQPLYEMGKKAAELLLSLINEEHHSHGDVIMPYTLREGDSIKDLNV
ncbi:MAG: LacI family DNA-binding transcriptional regulator [Clostridia bacterium]|nr:LacI family DNA-binding transcriptional regulator [Clostridia bacterium]